MIDSLHAKLSLALLAVLALAASALLALSARSSQLYQQEVQQKLNVDLAAHIVDEYPLIRASQVNSESVEDLFHQLMVVNPSIEVYLLDPEGTILSYSAPPGRVQRTRLSLAPVEAFLRGESPYPLLGDDPRDLTGGKVFSAAPIRTDGRLEGYLYVVLSGEAYTGVAGMLGRSYILRLTAWVVGAVLLMSLAMAAFLFRRLTRPLATLDRRMQAFAASELESTDASGDEVARLEESFERMSARIRDQIAELERNDRLRRELVANVSHDLRTPLTHLQGYLDTLVLKHDVLSDAEQAEYLQIAVRHSERLGRLVGDLFELAKLDALQAPVRTESISIAELARDVVANSQLAAADQGVTLVADARDGDCAVDADAVVNACFGARPSRRGGGELRRLQV